MSLCLFPWFIKYAEKQHICLWLWVGDLGGLGHSHSLFSFIIVLGTSTTCRELQPLEGLRRGHSQNRARLLRKDEQLKKEELISCVRILLWSLTPFGGALTRCIDEAERTSSGNRGACERMSSLRQTSAGLYANICCCLSSTRNEPLTGGYFYLFLIA